MVQLVENTGKLGEPVEYRCVSGLISMTIPAVDAAAGQRSLLKYYELLMRCENDIWPGRSGGFGGVGDRKHGYHDTIGFVALIQYRRDSITSVNTLVVLWNHA